MNYGEQIKYWRVKKNMTQKQLAEIAGVSEISIRKYESNDRAPKIGTLYKIAKALEISIGDLDQKYSIMRGDRNDVKNLEKQLKKFLEDIPNTRIPEDSKQKNIAKINELIGEVSKLIDMIDTVESSDRELKQILDENKAIKEDIKKAEQDIDDMFLFILHQLNFDGQEKAILYATDLTKIPEYRKDPDGE